MINKGIIGALYRTIFPKTGTNIPISIREMILKNKIWFTNSFSLLENFDFLNLIENRINIMTIRFNNISGIKSGFFKSIILGLIRVFIIAKGIHFKKVIGFPSKVGA